jgi:hypothetical protein
MPQSRFDGVRIDDKTEVTPTGNWRISPGGVNGTGNTVQAQKE